MITRSEDEKKIEQILQYFAVNDIHIIKIFHPNQYQETCRYILYDSYVTPTIHGIDYYTIVGKDITDTLFQNKNFLPFQQTDIFRQSEIESYFNQLKTFRFKFSKNYEFELIEVV